MEPTSDTIWHNAPSLDELNELAGRGLAQHLGIQFVEIGSDFLRATMPVDSRTHQPFGMLHGGASVALAETMGSAAGVFCVDRQKRHCVGIEINANHVRSVREGHVTATARPVHLGRTTQVWSIRITDEGGQLVCVSRLTMAVVDRRT